jgi:dTDP-4-amino-4,6-dideoxygalactose transaminase
MGLTQMRAAIKGLAGLAALNERRRDNGMLYTAALEAIARDHVDRALHADHLFLKYPLLVEDRPEFLRRAERANIPLGDWFCSPLHPIVGDLSKWDFDLAQYPKAVFAALHVVNLPTDTKHPQRVIDFIVKNADLILPAVGEGAT